MSLDQYRDNWNYMFEWKRGVDSKWFPCHIINNNQTNDKRISIYTRNGTVLHELPENVRKMSEEDYINYREEYLLHLGKHYKTYGFHDTCEEDLDLLRKI